MAGSGLCVPLAGVFPDGRDVTSHTHTALDLRLGKRGPGSSSQYLGSCRSVPQALGLLGRLGRISQEQELDV